MKTVYIDQLQSILDSGVTRLDDFFQVSAMDRKTTAQGKAYMSLKLRDKTGEVNGKMWDVPEDLPTLRVGGCIKVRAEIGTYRDDLQLKVLKVRLLTAEETVLDDYLPASKRDRDQMLQELDDLLCTVSDAHPGLREALLSVAYDPAIRPLLRNAPAAKKNHQPYLGGLLEHILNLASLAHGVYCAYYPNLDLDLLIAAAFLHDIGKCWELHFTESIGYSRMGSLVGHVVMGAQVVNHRMAAALDRATYEHLMHLIVSHHGVREWGAPVVPMTREAHVFHCLDMIDSRMGIIDGLLAGGVNADGLTSYSNALEAAVWNGQ